MENAKDIRSETGEEQRSEKSLCGCLVIDECGCIEDACNYEPSDCNCYLDPCVCQLR